MTATSTKYVRFYRGSPEAYANVIKNNDTLYFVYNSDSDKGSLYLGDRLISGDISNITDLKGLNKKEQELLSDIFQLLKDRLLEEERKDKAYSTIKYLYYFLQSMDQIEELKYILAYFAKYNGLIKPLEFIFNEDKQYMFEGILYSAMTLYTNGNPSKSKVSESHKRFEADIESKKEEQLSRTQELNTFKQLALQELGYASITEANAKEVFEKIAEIMSRKF